MSADTDLSFDDSFDDLSLDDEPSAAEPSVEETAEEEPISASELSLDDDLSIAEPPVEEAEEEPFVSDDLEMPSDDDLSADNDIPVDVTFTEDALPADDDMIDLTDDDNEISLAEEPLDMSIEDEGAAYEAEDVSEPETTETPSEEDQEISLAEEPLVEPEIGDESALDDEAEMPLEDESEEPQEEPEEAKPAPVTVQVLPASSGNTAAASGKSGGRDIDIPVGLKSELRNILSYMDQLLESLPEQKIEEFAKSEYFDSYKKLFKELGLV